MKLNNEDFDLMLSAAWSAFENTLFLWGMTKEQIDKFSDVLDSKGAIEDVLDALQEVVDWEEE